MNTKTKIAGVEFGSYIFNAAGPNDSTLEEGASCFERINKEFEEIMQRKNYNSINEVKGNLKFL